MSRITLPYLGFAGAMNRLPSPNSPMDAPPDRKATVHTLITGGQRTTQRLHAKQSYSLPFQLLTEADSDLISALYRGLYDPPAGTDFVFVDPSVRNVLGLDVSTMGLRAGASAGWVSGGGTLVATTTGGPSGVQSGVLTWTPSASSKAFNPGPTSGTADVTRAPVHIPGESVTVSLWIKSASSVSVTFQVGGYGTDGSFSSVLATTVVAATTSWQRVSLSFAMTSTTLGFVLPRLVSSATTALSIAGAQTEYASSVSAWQPGYGSPRVSIVAPPGRSVQLLGYADHTLTLAGV
jgi:hypothetical protein